MEETSSFSYSYTVWWGYNCCNDQETTVMLDGCAEHCWGDARALQTENQCLDLLEVLWSVTKATVSSVVSSFKFKSLMGIAEASPQLRGQCPFMSRELPVIILSLPASQLMAQPSQSQGCTELLTVMVLRAPQHRAARSAGNLTAYFWNINSKIPFHFLIEP